MKGFFKKTLSMFLCFVMVFTMFQGTMLSASAKVVGPDNKTELTITADKANYSWGDTIIFTINVKNVTSETLRGIKIKSMAREVTQIAQQGDLPVISELQPGESTTVQIEYYATKLASFLIIFMPIFWMFNPIGKIAYREAPFNYEQKVKIGLFKHKIGFAVEYNYDGGSDSNETVKITYILGDVKANSFDLTQNVIKDKVPEEPDIPTSEDYVFVGWFSDELLTIPYYFEKPLCKDITLYAKWIPISIDDIDFTKYGTAQKDVSLSFEDAIVDKITVDYRLEKGIGNVVIERATGLINNIYSKIGSAVDITIDGQDHLDHATIKFKYNENSLPEGIAEDDLGIVWFDEQNNKMVLLENTVIDKENDIISVETTHFSKYVVVNSTAWVKHWEHKQLVSRVDGNTVRFNIVLCLDDSGSMSGTAKNVCQQAARNFVDQLVDGDNIAVVKFNSNPTTLVSSTSIIDKDGESNKETIKNKIILKASGGTNFNKSIDLAISILNSMPGKTTENEILKSYIVFLSDGQSSVGDSQISELIKWGYNVIAIGVGNSVSANELRKLATESGGNYAHVSDPSQISSVFEQVQGEYIGLSVDSDGDGIADLVEKTGMIATDGNIYRTDPNNPDTDGDGRSDGEEMGIYNDANGCFEINSSPTTPTSDSVGFEVNFYVSPKSYSSTDIENYKNITVKAVVNAFGGHAFPVNDLGLTDYLSDVDYQDVKDVKIEFFKDDALIYTFEDDKILEGTSTMSSITQTLNDLSDCTYSVKITTSNAGTVVKEYNYSPFAIWYNNINKLCSDAEKQMLTKATKAVKAYGNVVKNKENDITNAIMLNCMDIVVGNNQHYELANSIANELQKVLSQKIIDQAKYWSENSGWGAKNAEDVVKEIAKRCAADSDEFNVVIGRYEYDVHMNEIGKWEAASFGTVTVTNKTTNEQFEFAFATDQNVINNAIDNFMDECKTLYNKSLDFVIDQTLSDASAILSINQLKAFIKSKIGEHFDALMENNGVNLGFTFNELKSCYDCFQKAKSAIESARDDNTNTNKLSKTMNNINSFLTAANEL